MVGSVSAPVLLVDDHEAEERLVAIAIESTRGAALAFERVDPGFLYDKRLAAVYRCAARCPAASMDDRIRWVATAAGESRAWLWSLCQLPRIALVDEHGHYAKRILEMAERRPKVLVALDELERLTGVRLDHYVA